MSSGAEIACVLMAAGESRRFGGNKLLAELNGKPVFMHAFDAIPEELLSRTIVVSGYDDILNEGRARGYVCVRNDVPEEGPARTIRLGIEAAGDAGACMFCVCDQPAVQRGSLKRLLLDYDGDVRALSFGGRRGNPVVFPRELFEELCHIPDGKGGSWVLNHHPRLLSLRECGCARELEDVDTPRSLDALRRLSNVFFEDETRETFGRLLTGEDRILPGSRARIGGREVPLLALGSAQEGRPEAQRKVWSLLDAEEPAFGVVTDPAPWLRAVRARMDTVVGSDMPDGWKTGQIALAAGLGPAENDDK